MTFEIQKRGYWDPFHEMEKLQDALNQAFDTSLLNWGGSRAGLLDRAWGPAVDIYESKDNVVVRADIPGMRKEDIEVTIQDNTLAIKGERKVFEEKKDQDNLRVERAYGAFSRAFTLPTSVDSSKVKAVYKDGVLELTIPKQEEAKPKQINVDVK